MEATPEPPSAQADGPHASAEEELAALHARVQALEAELAVTHLLTNAAIAAAQERVYWLDRWHVDLDELMRRRSAVAVRAGLRAVRVVLRLLRRLQRAIR